MFPLQKGFSLSFYSSVLPFLFPTEKGAYTLLPVVRSSVVNAEVTET